MKAKVLDFIEWEDRETGLKLFGRVRKLLEKSVIVDIIGIDYSTVVSHKRYSIIKEADVDATAGKEFQRARGAVGRKKRIHDPYGKR